MRYELLVGCMGTLLCVGCADSKPETERDPDSIEDEPDDTGASARADAGTDSRAAGGDGSQTLLDARADGAMDGAVVVPVSQCGALTEQHPDEGKGHAPECDPVQFNTQPPSSGTHYGRTPMMGVYDTPLPRGYWVHLLEHGAIVVTYNCPDGCPDEVAKAEAFMASLPVDDVCVTDGFPDRHRAILTPDPLLDTRWAASSWTHTLRASCFEPDVFLSFYVDHHGRGLENHCRADFDARTDAGTLNLAVGCGQPRSDAGI